MLANFAIRDSNFNTLSEIGQRNEEWEDDVARCSRVDCGLFPNISTAHGGWTRSGWVLGWADRGTWVDWTGLDRASASASASAGVLFGLSSRFVSAASAA
jgi:hypothetical protein